jgi:hypothetical protein
MDQEDFSPCEEYLDTKQIYPSNEIKSLVNKILRADPDPNGSNCEWLIDSYLLNQFRLDEDEIRVKEDIIKYKELYGQRRPLPKKGYTELKVMNRQKEEKSTKKSTSKSITKFEITDCKSFYKNVKNTLPEPYNHYSNVESNELFQKIQDANPTDDYRLCIWIVEEIKKGFIKENQLNEVREYLKKYIKEVESPLPNFYPSFPIYSNFELVKDIVDKNVDLLYTGDFGILLIPKTKETSCYYGAQTSWCTARRDENNRYNLYSSKGDIYIWFDKNIKDKFQFHFEEVQFMDRDDTAISKKRFKEFLDHPVLSILFQDGIEKIKNLKSTRKIINFVDIFYPEMEYIIQSPYFFEKIKKSTDDIEEIKEDIERFYPDKYDEYIQSFEFLEKIKSLKKGIDIEYYMKQYFPDYFSKYSQSNEFLEKIKSNDELRFGLKLMEKYFPEYHASFISTNEFKNKVMNNIDYAVENFSKFPFLNNKEFIQKIFKQNKSQFFYYNPRYLKQFSVEEILENPNSPELIQSLLKYENMNLLIPPSIKNLILEISNYLLEKPNMNVEIKLNNFLEEILNKYQYEPFLTSYILNKKAINLFKYLDIKDISPSYISGIAANTYRYSENFNALVKYLSDIQRKYGLDKLLELIKESPELIEYFKQK